MSMIQILAKVKYQPQKKKKIIEKCMYIWEKYLLMIVASLLYFFRSFDHYKTVGPHFTQM